MGSAKSRRVDRHRRPAPVAIYLGSADRLV